MAKRKSNIRGEFRGEPKRRLWWLRLLRFLLTPPGLYLTLIIVATALLYWYWANIVSWATDVINSTLRLFGWGLVLMIIAVAILVGGQWIRKLSSVIRRWHYWLGGIAFTLAAWGILAFFNLGGSFALGITGYTDFVAILRILGLVIIGIILVAPRLCFHLAVK